MRRRAVEESRGRHGHVAWRRGDGTRWEVWREHGRHGSATKTRWWHHRAAGAALAGRRRHPTRWHLVETGRGTLQDLGWLLAGARLAVAAGVVVEAWWRLRATLLLRGAAVGVIGVRRRLLGLLVLLGRVGLRVRSAHKVHEEFSVAVVAGRGVFAGRSRRALTSGSLMLAAGEVAEELIRTSRLLLGTGSQNLLGTRSISASVTLLVWTRRDDSSVSRAVALRLLLRRREEGQSGWRCAHSLLLKLGKQLLEGLLVVGWMTSRRACGKKGSQIWRAAGWWGSCSCRSRWLLAGRFFLRLRKE